MRGDRGRKSSYYVYIVTNKVNTVLYTGVTNDLTRRAYEHSGKFVNGFTSRYNATKLVYYELTGDVESAITREKQIKGLLRKKKVALIESMNPKWLDLSLEWMEDNEKGPDFTLSF